MTDYADWTESDRIVFNIGAAYRDLGGPQHTEAELPGMVSQFWAKAHGRHNGEAQSTTNPPRESHRCR